MKVVKFHFEGVYNPTPPHTPGQWLAVDGVGVAENQIVYLFDLERLDEETPSVPILRVLFKSPFVGSYVFECDDPAVKVAFYRTGELDLAGHSLSYGDGFMCDIAAVKQAAGEDFIIKPFTATFTGE